MTFLDLMNQAKEEKQILVGVGVDLIQDEEGEDIVKVVVNQTNEENGDIIRGEVLIAREDTGEFSRNFSLIPFLDKKVYFQVKEIVGSTVYGTRTVVEKAEQRLIHKELTSGKYVKAEVSGFYGGGAFLRYKSVSGTLANEDYTGKDVNIRQFLDFSDVVEVKVVDVYKNQNGQTLYKFEPKEMHEIREGEGFTKYNVGQVVEGRVTGFIPTGMFVNIEPGVDVLSSMPASGEIEKGKAATVRITVINPENGQMRGKVVETFVDIKEEIDTLEDLQSLIDEEGDELISLDELMNNTEDEEEEEIPPSEEGTEDDEDTVDDFEEEIRRMAEDLEEK